MYWAPTVGYYVVRCMKDGSVHLCWELDTTQMSRERDRRVGCPGAEARRYSQSTKVEVGAAGTGIDVRHWVVGANASVRVHRP
jgi:hypothetical protein